MKAKQHAVGADLAFRAFSDRTRLRILCLLQHGELCVGDLVQIIRTPQPTASRHLAYLRRAKLVVTRRNGQWTFYNLSPARTQLHRKLLECVAHCFDELAEIKADSKRAARLKRAGGCCPR